jgi:hypothetical protein
MDDEMPLAEALALEAVEEDHVGAWAARLARPQRTRHAIEAARTVYNKNHGRVGMETAESMRGQVEYVLEHKYGYGPWWVWMLWIVCKLAINCWLEQDDD